MKFTKYEKARIIGARALQISMGAPLLLKISKAKMGEINYNPIKIAKLEFEKDAIPITIRRPLPEKVEKE
jgi:DNA-directed RNA polymerase subunit K/omega